MHAEGHKPTDKYITNLIYLLFSWLLKRPTKGTSVSTISTITPAKQVISLKEAQKLLGHKAKTLTNKELQTLIQETETVVRLSIRTYISSKNIEKNDNIREEISL